VDRITSWIESLQGIKIEAWNIHLLRPDGNIKTIQAHENALVHFRVDLRSSTLAPEFGTRFAFEGPYHAVT
jgi:hypothetical protein